MDIDADFFGETPEVLSVFNIASGEWEHLNEGTVSFSQELDLGYVVNDLINSDESDSCKENVDPEVPIDLTKKPEEAENESAVTEEAEPNGRAAEEEGKKGRSSKSARKTPGRKRSIESQTIAGAKKLKDSNEDYYDSNKKLIQKKLFINFECKLRSKKKVVQEDGVLDLRTEEEEKEQKFCRRNCTKKVDSETREKIFNEFYALGDYNKQNLFLASSVIEVTKERETKKTATNTDSTNARRKNRKKKFSRVYLLNSIPVCRDMFTQTLQVSSKRINTAVKKHRNLELQDKRGEKQAGKNALTEDQLKCVRDHIEKFPRYVSHYCRSTTDSEFLSPDMTITKMYQLYVESLIGEENVEKINTYRYGDAASKKQILTEVGGVSLSSYKRIFLRDFNLKFKSLKKDTCNKCDSYLARLTCCTESQKKVIEKEHDEHLLRAETARKEMKKDQQLAKDSPTFECLTFDLQKVLPLPRIPANMVYYKRKVCVYNLGIHSFKKDLGYFHIWTEAEGSRGSQEIGSCLIKFITKFLWDNPGITDLVLYADTCTGQNRNIKVTLLTKAILEAHPSLKSVTFKFLESGHTFLPNDSDFGDVECALKHVQRLYTPEDYMEVMSKSRSKKPFIVTRMESKDFFTSENLEKMIVNRKEIENEEDKKINWLKLKRIKLLKSEPYRIYCCEDFESEFKVVNLARKVPKKSKRPPRQQPSSFNNALKPMWPNGKSICDKKLQDLRSMSHLIPKDAMKFYNSLTGDEAIIDDLDGFCNALDFEVDPDFAMSCEEITE